LPAFEYKVYTVGIISGLCLGRKILSNEKGEM